MQVVLDSAVFEHVKVFQVHVLKGTTKDGATLTCNDIPNPYRMENPQLVQVVKPLTVAANPQAPTTSVKTEKITVPSGEPLVFVARGLAPWKGTYVVGRGCLDNQTLAEGERKVVNVDVKASTGRQCGAPADCEPNLTCVRGSGFSEGYCAVQGCGTGGECPPGSACISASGLGGLCMRLCKSISDCEVVFQEPQDCQGRLGLSAQGCSRVCVYPLWEKAGCCSGCGGGGDGGV